jgi:cell division protein DivIC
VPPDSYLDRHKRIFTSNEVHITQIKNSNLTKVTGTRTPIDIIRSNRLNKMKMKNPYKDKRWFKLMSNKYVWVLLFFVVWMLFLDNYSYFDHRFLDHQINELQDNKKYYQEEIKKDQEQIKQLKNPEQIEKYAREKYFMKKDSEDIYIIQFEGDTIQDTKE